VPIVLKSGSLSLLDPSGPVMACNGIDYLDMGECLVLVVSLFIDYDREAGGKTLFRNVGKYRMFILSYS
jgi:hypothetical protein